MNLKKLKHLLKKYKKGKIDENEVIARFAIYFWQESFVQEEVEEEPSEPQKLMDMFKEYLNDVDYDATQWVEYNPNTDPIPDTWDNVKVTITSPFNFGDNEENEA